MDSNAEEAPGQKWAEDEKEKKEKRMKIKINFKPYIPKIKKGNRRKQETEFRFYRKPVSPIKEDAKAFIKLKDISLLTNPQKPSEVFAKDIIFLDDEEECITKDQEPINYTINITDPNWNTSNYSTEPLDLSVKSQTLHSPQILREELLPLDLSKPKEYSERVTIEEKDTPKQRNSQTINAEYTRENNKIVHEIHIPVDPPVSHSNIVTLGCSTGTSTGDHVIAIHPVQWICTQTQVSQQGQSQESFVETPMATESAIENSYPGKISRRKKEGNAKHPEDSSQNLLKCNIFSSNMQAVAPENIKQKAVAENQKQEGILYKLGANKKVQKRPRNAEFSTKSKQQQGRNMNSSDSKEKQNNDIPIKSQITTREGMVKINEKITSNGGVFCTFRNFTNSGVKTTRGKAADKHKRKSQK